MEDKSRCRARNTVGQNCYGPQHHKDPCIFGGMIDNYKIEEFGDKGRIRNGSPIFYDLLKEMAETHDRKSHDYASDSDPFGNYHFAGKLSQLFSNPDDAGFIGRLGEKLYRLANLENSGKIAVNETIEDTERDLAVIITLWMVDRRDKRARKKAAIEKVQEQMRSGEWGKNYVE